MIDYRQIKSAAIVHHLAHQTSRRHGLAVITHGNDACVLHRCDFGERFAFAAHGSGADGPDTHCSGGRGSLNDSTSNGGVIVYGLGVGHGTHSGEAAARRRARASFDRFRKFLAGFAQVTMQIDETGRDDHPRRVENFCIGR